MTTTTEIKRKITLYEMRQQSGKKGSVVARLCQTTYRSLRNWELGTTIPNVVNIHDLLQIYDYSFEELDLTPFYGTYKDRTEKQKQIDDESDNPLRSRRQFEQTLDTNEQPYSNGD